MLKKFLIIILIVIGSYIAFINLPLSIRQKFGALVSENITDPLIKKISPASSREIIIKKLNDNLNALDEIVNFGEKETAKNVNQNSAPQSSQKSTKNQEIDPTNSSSESFIENANRLITETKNLLKELLEKNSEKGIKEKVIEQIIERVLPAPTPQNQSSSPEINPSTSLRINDEQSQTINSQNNSQCNWVCQ